MLKTVQYLDRQGSITGEVLKPFLIDIARNYNLVFEGQTLNLSYPEVPIINFLDENREVLWTSGFRLPGHFIEQIEVMLDEKKRNTHLYDNQESNNGTSETTTQSTTTGETQIEAQAGSEGYETDKGGNEETLISGLSI